MSSNVVSLFADQLTGAAKSTERYDRIHGRPQARLPSWEWRRDWRLRPVYAGSGVAGPIFRAQRPRYPADEQYSQRKPCSRSSHSRTTAVCPLRSPRTRSAGGSVAQSPEGGYRRSDAAGGIRAEGTLGPKLVTADRLLRRH
jgi:hypothetical protein